LPGTVIHTKPVKGLPPIIVVKENQVMIELISKDFSFVEEKPIGELFHLFEKLKLKPNLTQNGAISMICVMDDRADKIEKLAMEASTVFDVQLTRSLTLLTIRHYTKDIYEKTSAGKKTLLQQRTTDTVQALLQ
jgi:aspartate kinase